MTVITVLGQGPNFVNDIFLRTYRQKWGLPASFGIENENRTLGLIKVSCYVYSNPTSSLYHS